MEVRRLGSVEGNLSSLALVSAPVGATAHAGNAPPFVRIDKVDLRYGGEGGTLALQDLSLKVQEGEVLAVVGPSGCGKSTLMKIVTGLWKPSAGRVTVAGRTVDGPISIVGMAFQNSIMLPWRTTLRNVMLPLEMVEPHKRRLRANRSEYKARALALLDLVGLKDFAYKSPWQLSGGMQQRAALCRALIHEPKLLMLDEPFAALDAFTREELWLVLQDLYLRQQPTVVIVTHDLREALFLADRVVVMSNRPGRIVHEVRIDLPRPRRLQEMFAPHMVALTQQLREQIALQRQEVRPYA
jgi:NitT/TauT family transport system ATP-binding protein